MPVTGLPIWFELSTPDQDAATAFYARLFGWEVVSAGMEGFDYRLARKAEVAVAGLMPLSACPEGTPPSWMVYFGTEEVDETTEEIEATGGYIWKAPTDIPRTGRFSVVSDPQGAMLGLLEPLPMAEAPEVGAWDQTREGHGCWLELMTDDAKAAMGFYHLMFGWQPDGTHDLGPMGSYHIFAHEGAQIGGMMGLDGAPQPYWLCYFGVANLAASIATAQAAGGQLLSGPTEVAGPALVAVLADPQGARFAIVGPKP